MTNKNTRPDSLTDLMRELGNEIEEEEQSARPNDEHMLNEVAKRLLKLERDMTMPGTQVQAAQRVERLSKAIEDEEF